MSHQDAQLPLDFTRPRPCGVGYKERGGASQAVAEELAESGRAQRLRQLVTSYFEAGHQATADEAAAALGENILAIRPRVSELRKAGIIIPAGERRPSSSGKPSTVWKRNAA